ncbi:bifunctional nuclease domain-containing protein [Corynebacterium pseudopelargi]|uniref:BFN domain-containing protein n=1 Tax=Corynebacterium pseudopelargi TaxID=2080757 RepID=A0A3G6IUN3_9CORY|nr:bifunctional nuclease domain-containing protein [Corynebacterium pseudopelargi]AZA09316.1 hypothetical protein CPPEL_05985 [Corynebacterium pseudopelargi]
MTYQEVSFIGVATVSPELAPCTLLFDTSHQRVLALWLPDDASEALSDGADEGYARRPSSTDVLLEALDKTGAKIEALRIDSVYQGVYHCSIVLGEGVQIDCKPSQLLLLAQAATTPVEVHEQVLVDASVKVPPQEFLEYFGIEPPEDLEAEHVSASGDDQADADFAAFMEQMGLKESDLFAEEDQDDTPDDDAQDTGVTDGK